MKDVRIHEYTSVRVVGPKCGSLELKPVRYVRKHLSQLCMQINGDNFNPIFFMSPLFIRVTDQLSIGTDARESVAAEAIESLQLHFKVAKPVGLFTSGPISGMFALSETEQALACLETEGEKHVSQKMQEHVLEVPRTFYDQGADRFIRQLNIAYGEWRQQTEHFLRELHENVGLPLLAFKTYEQASAFCGYDVRDA